METQLKSVLLRLGIILSPFLFMNTGCPDQCADYPCVNGTKVEQAGGGCKCVCDSGYEGVDCNDLIVTITDSTFTGEAICDPNTYTYTITVVEGPGPDKLTFINIHNTGDTAIGDILFENEFNITFQTYGSGSISGSGSYEANNYLNLEYEIYGPSGAEYCNFESD